MQVKKLDLKLLIKILKINFMNYQYINDYKIKLDENLETNLQDLPNYITWLKDSENGRESFERLKVLVQDFF